MNKNLQHQHRSRGSASEPRFHWNLCWKSLRCPSHTLLCVSFIRQALAGNKVSPSPSQNPLETHTTISVFSSLTAGTCTCMTRCDTRPLCKQNFLPSVFSTLANMTAAAPLDSLLEIFYTSEQQGQVQTVWGTVAESRKIWSIFFW